MEAAMGTSTRRGNALALAAAAASLLAGVAAPSPAGADEPAIEIEVVEVQPGDGTVVSSVPRDINDRGQVVGVYEGPTDDRSLSRVFSWRDGRWTSLSSGTGPAPDDGVHAVDDKGDVVGRRQQDVPFPPQEIVAWGHRRVTVAPLDLVFGDFPLPSAVNDKGQAVIGYIHAGGNGSTAALWDIGGDVVDLGSLGGANTFGADINGKRQIVGSSSPEPGFVPVHAFRWDDGVMTDLGTLGGDLSEAVAINEHGQVVGNSRLDDGRQHAFLWEDGVMTDLGTLGGGFSNAVDINDKGQVLGWSSNAAGRPRGFVWEDGVMTDLGTLGTGTGTTTEVRAINERGQVVGTSRLDDGSQHAFLWDDGEMVDLHTATPEAEASAAVDINDKGEIVGTVDQRVEGRLFPLSRTVVWTVDDD
jgi:probable HAF family extracellular repeat protein